MHREARISNYILAAFSLVSLTLLSLPLAAPVQAFKVCATYVLSPSAFYGEKGAQRLATAPARVRELLRADVENRSLREEIKRSAWLNAEIESLKAENQRLRVELRLKAPQGRTPLWAHVMERDPLHWYHSLIVDAGSEQDISVNAPVLGPRGDGLAAIGRVVEVRPRSSIVLLLNDELSSVAATLSSSTLEGLIQGQGSSRLLMNYISPEAALEAGEWVYTSPTSATFPPDILIGKVVRVKARDPFFTFQSVEVAPALEASALKEVMILKKQGAAAVKSAPSPPARPQEEENDEEGGEK